MIPGAPSSSPFSSAANQQLPSADIRNIAFSQPLPYASLPAPGGDLAAGAGGPQFNGASMPHGSPPPLAATTSSYPPKDPSRKEEFQRERAVVSHAVTSKVFDFRNRDGGSESQNAVSSSGTPIPTTGPFIVFLKNLPSNSVDSSAGTTTTSKLEKQLGEKMGIIPIRSRVIVKGISAIAFLEVSTRHDMTLLLAMKNLSFVGRLLPVDVANESQRTDPDRLFDPFCNGPSSSPAAPNPQQGSTSVERTTSKSSFGRGGGGRGSGSGSFKRSPAGSMSHWTRHSGETEGNGADASANVSFSGNSPSLGSALKTTQQGANDATTRAHSNNNGSFGSATGPGISPSKAFPLAAPSSKAWRPSGKAVRFANESSGGPAIGEINYDSSGNQSINNSFSSATPSQSGTVAAGSAQLPGSAELLWRHRHRALIGGLNDTVTAHDLRKLFEDVGLTVIAVEAVPANENETPAVCKSMYMEVGDEEQLKHVLCQHGRRIKGIEMTITLPPPAQQQERKGSIQRSSSDDPASAFLTRALAAEVTLMSMDYDEAAKREENEGTFLGCPNFSVIGVFLPYFNCD